MQETMNPMQIGQRRQPVPQRPAQGNLVEGNRQEWEEAMVQQNAIGIDEVHEATERLRRYQAGKANLDERIVENERWWRLRHWEMVRARQGRKEHEPLEPASAWLFNCIANKHADAMDNFPEVSVLPREAGDQETAATLTSILPVVLEENHYEEVYDKVWWYKLKSGTGVTGVFWDGRKDNGVGNIEIRKVDVLKLFWEPEVTDIQESEHVYCVEVMSLEQLKDRYGEKVKDYAGGSEVTLTDYRHDDMRETSDRVMVVDWYYKRQNSQGQTVLHLCKYVGEIILFATENPPEEGREDLRERGWYDHGLYPFVPDPLFPVEDSVAGFGYVDVMRDPQMYIDQLDSLILRNAQQHGKKRYFMSTDSGVNKEQFADWTQDIVDVEGGMNETNIKEIEVSALDSSVHVTRQNKIDELKETSGNRDFSQGGTSNGITAASAIAALQEAGSKLSRDMIKASYRAFEKVCSMCIELIRQFYTAPRTFRITGKDGGMDFATFDNSALQPMPMPAEFGQAAYRKALFDLKIKSHRASPFSRISQNELAKELFGMGIFNPEMADQALMLLDMMDFDGIDQLRQKIAQRGTIFEQMQAQIMMLTEQLALLTGQDPVGELPPGQAMPEAAQKAGGRDPLRTAAAGRERMGPNAARERAQNIG